MKCRHPLTCGKLKKEKFNFDQNKPKKKTSFYFLCLVLEVVHVVLKIVFYFQNLGGWSWIYASTSETRFLMYIFRFSSALAPKSQAMGVSFYVTVGSRADSRMKEGMAPRYKCVKGTVWLPTCVLQTEQGIPTGGGQFWWEHLEYGWTPRVHDRHLQNLTLYSCVGSTTQADIPG